MSNLKVMSSPKHVDIAITGKCNLACQYCFYVDEMVAYGFIGIQTSEGIENSGV